MRPTPKLALTLAGSQPQSQQQSLRWLSSLKSTQLQQIARATGLQSSGRKSILSARIERALCPFLPQYENANPRLDVQDGGRARRERSLRVLSIDMGIRNMAFAVLRIAGTGGPRSGTAGGVCASPELLAWRRLAVSEVGGLDLGESSYLAGSGLTESESSVTSTIEEECAARPSLPDTTTTTNVPDPTPKESKESFSPPLYAKTAYTLITTLLRRYNPTHILIERQRFRSGGASAVQEWTLRVGVLEGMLYAVLETLRREGRLSGEGVEVWGVEPKRVVGFWGEGADGSGDCGGGRKRVSAREVKKGKIDRVGRWLDGSSVSGSGDGLGGRIVIPDENTVVRELANAYLRRWRGENGKRRNEDSTGQIGKLDDLADCLLQGITWLEWQVMRERLAREGVEALKLCR